MAPVNNRNIRDWLKPIVKPPSNAPTYESSSAAGTTLEAPTMRAANTPKSTTSHSKTQTAQTPSSESKASNRTDPTSSLSPPPSTDLSEHPVSSQKENTPFKPASSSENRSERVIQNSDDEDEDSDSSLEDLSVLLAARSADRARQGSNGLLSSTPEALKPKSNIFDFHTSPLPVLSKYRIDMKSLIDSAQTDAAAEAKAKRVKAMLEARRKDDDDVPLFQEKLVKAKADHGSLLDSVVAEREDGGGHKVKRALERTEATTTEKRWYFFDTQSSSPKPSQTSFPVSSLPKDWEADLADPMMRQHTFLSGFAASMVILGKKLPDELFLWMLDDICHEPTEPLRFAYLDTLKASSEQVKRLISPREVASLFTNLGASSEATQVTDKAISVLKLTNPYPHRDWGNLRSVIKLLGQLAKSMQLTAKTCSICMLLRMSMDKLVSENIDICDLLQETINRLCRAIDDEQEWARCCSEICTVLFNSVEESTFRLQIVSVISSEDARTRDLRRRLAMCFYFNNIFYAKQHSHLLMNMDRFITRLQDPVFNTNTRTDYQELTALILLLDIALADGRSASLDLTDAKVEEEFNKDADILRRSVKDILHGIGNPGAAFISRIEAKEVLELVSQRIIDTVRTKRPKKTTWFDDDIGKKAEDLQSEKKGMANYLSIWKEKRNGQTAAK